MPVESMIKMHTNCSATLNSVAEMSPYPTEVTVITEK